jgi:hypothetical protein
MNGDPSDEGQDGFPPERDGNAPLAGRVRPGRRWWYLLLILPFVALLVPPFYARADPHLAAWPFFYWWQFVWIPITSAIVIGVYWATTYHGPRNRDDGDSGGSAR